MRAAKQRFKRERDRRTVNRNFDDKTRITKVLQHSDEQMRIIVSRIVSKNAIFVFRHRYLQKKICAITIISAGLPKMVTSNLR